MGNNIQPILGLFSHSSLAYAICKATASAIDQFDLNPAFGTSDIKDIVKILTLEAMHLQYFGTRAALEGPQ